MPLDPGVRLGGPFSTATAQHVRRRPDGQLAYMPYEYHHIGEPSSISRAVSGFVQTVNPVSAAERVVAAYKAEHNPAFQKRMADLYKRDPSAYYTAMAPKPRDWIEGLGLPHPRTPEEWGASLAAFFPLKARGEGGAVKIGETRRESINVGEGIYDAVQPWLAFQGSEGQARFRHLNPKWPIYRNFTGDIVPLRAGEAVNAYDPHGDIVGSSHWLPDSVPLGRDEAGKELRGTYASDIFVQPSERGNQRLFQALAGPMLKDIQESNSPIFSMFANDKLQALAKRWLERRGYFHLEGMGDTFYPSGRIQGTPINVNEIFRR